MRPIAIGQILGHGAPFAIITSANTAAASARPLGLAGPASTKDDVESWYAKQ